MINCSQNQIIFLKFNWRINSLCCKLEATRKLRNYITVIPSGVKVPFAKLGSTFHWAEVWSKKSWPTDRPTIHPFIHEKVIDLRGYFPQIFETDQHFSVDFSCKIEGILKPTNFFSRDFSFKIEGDSTEKVIDLRSYFPQIFEIDQHFSYWFLFNFWNRPKFFLWISLLKLKVFWNLPTFSRDFSCKIEGDFYVNFKPIANFFETNQHF